MSDAVVAKRVLISGHVQGVWYRGSMQREAERLGLRGWVRNLPDGRVEALVEGPNADVNAIVRWCASGPPAARVSDVSTHDETPCAIVGFNVRY